jgi:hypothetical protein
MPPLVQRRNAPEAYGLRGGSEPDLTCGDAGGQGAGDREPVRPALYRRPFTRNVPRPICDPSCGTVILWAAGSVRLCRYLGAQCAADNEANRAVTTNLLLWRTQTYNDLVERPRAEALAQNRWAKSCDGSRARALYASRPLQRRVICPARTACRRGRILLRHWLLLNASGQNNEAGTEVHCPIMRPPRQAAQLRQTVRPNEAR